MKIESTHTDQGTEFRICEHGIHGHVLIALASKAGSSLTGKTILSGVRVVSSALNEGLDLTKSMSRCVQESNKLRAKIEFVTRLNLVPPSCFQGIIAGRIFIMTPSTPVSSQLTRLAEIGIAEIQTKYSVNIVSQYDYDQKKMGRSWTSSTFRSKHPHTPTALSTYATFHELGKLINVNARHCRWGIVGVGALGTRLAQLLLEKGCEHLSLFDISQTATAPFLKHPRVSVVSSLQEMCNRAVDMLCLSANSGTLTSTAATALARNQTLRVFGGPEAGLDSQSTATQLAIESGKLFAPSILCGCMGLATNVLEIQNREVSLSDQRKRLSARLGRLSESRTFQSNDWRRWLCEIAPSSTKNRTSHLA